MWKGAEAWKQMQRCGEWMLNMELLPLRGSVSKQWEGVRLGLGTAEAPGRKGGLRRWGSHRELPGRKVPEKFAF